MCHYYQESWKETDQIICAGYAELRRALRGVCLVTENMNLLSILNFWYTAITVMSLSHEAMGSDSY